MTGSEFKNVLARIKTGEAAGRRNYRAQLVVEILTGVAPERFKSAAMQWGNDTEDLAATTYMLHTGNVVEKCGFFKHNKHRIGVSPDRRIKNLKGCVEIKCYEIANHIQALRNAEMPAEHKPQVQGEIWATDSDFCDFVSFAPELPENAQLFIQRIYRDDPYIRMLEAELIEFEKEVMEEVQFVKSYNPAKELILA
jgi:predicted phage-related endonuclease